MIRDVAELDFFSIIGAQRSGTTYLYEILAQHPEIKMNKKLRPEPKFFLKNEEEQTTVQAYLQTVFTPPYSDQYIYGEKSTSYLEFPEIAERLEKCLPQPRVLVILRNPVDRAISNYSFSKNSGLENRSPEEALDIESENELAIPEKLSVSPYAYVSRGRYAYYLKAYREIFGNRMMIIVLEDLIGNLELIQEVFRFVGASPEFIPLNYVTSKNSSPEMEVSIKVRDRLKQFYIPWNDRLQNEYNISLAAWK